MNPGPSACEVDVIPLHHVPVCRISCSFAGGAFRCAPGRGSFCARSVFALLRLGAGLGVCVCCLARSWPARLLLVFVHYIAGGFEDTLAEWLRRRPAKPMGSPRVGSNPTGVALRRSLVALSAAAACMLYALAGRVRCASSCLQRRRWAALGARRHWSTVAILSQGTSRAVAVTQAFWHTRLQLDRRPRLGQVRHGSCARVFRKCNANARVCDREGLVNVSGFRRLLSEGAHAFEAPLRRLAPRGRA